MGDAKCHKTGAASSYRCAVGFAVNTATVTTYTDTTCSTGKTVVLNYLGGNTCDGSTSTVDTKLYGNVMTMLYYSSVGSYDSKTGNCTTPATPTQLVTTTVPVDTCTPTSTCSDTANVFSGISCSSSYSHKQDTAAIFGSKAYVIVEKYTAGSYCSLSKLLGITTYLADGRCHETATMTSFRVTRASDGTVSIKMYANSQTCTGAVVTAPITTATTSCEFDAAGVADAKYFAYGTTDWFLTLKLSFDTKVGDCKPPVVPIFVMLTAKDYAETACVPATTCTGTAAPYARIGCSTPTTYHEDMIALFGATPFVTQAWYAGTTCAMTQLSSIATYLADGKCHNSLGTGYRATRYADGSATILKYLDTSCTSSSPTKVEITATQASGAICIAASGSSTKANGRGVTPFYLLTTAKYDTSAGDCKLPATPIQLASSVVAVDSCTPTTTCSGSSAPYSAISCSSTFSYKADTALVFGSNPYVVVEKYVAGQSCDAARLSGMSAYLADGKCHKTGTSASYSATRLADGSATIKTFADSTDCATTGTDMAVTAAQATAYACVTGSVADQKYYGSGYTPLYFSIVATYDTTANSCSAPAVPSVLSTSIVAAGTCRPSLACSGAVAPFTATTCGSTLSFKADTAAAFGSNPFVVVEKYVSGQGCDPSKLSSIAAYLADGKCHKTGQSASYAATRAADGSATIKTYADSATCATAGTTLVVTAAQTTASACVPSVTTGIGDIKSYGEGKTPTVVTSTMVYDTNTGDCKWPVVPTQVVSSVVSADACTPSVACSGAVAPFTAITCGSTLSFKADTAAAFGSNPFVVVEKYVSGQGCDPSKLSSIAAYLADGKCHKTGQSASYAATRAADGSATIKTYADSATCATAGTAFAVTDSPGGCKVLDENGDIRSYGGGSTPLCVSRYEVSAGEDGVCDVGVMPVQVLASVMNSDILVALNVSGITTGIMNGDCQATDLMESIRVTKTNGSVTISAYPNSAVCLGDSISTIVTVDQITDNACINLDGQGSSVGTEPLYFSSKVIYDTDTGACKPPATPIKVSTRKSDVDSCEASDACTGDTNALFSGLLCSTPSHYEDDLSVAFGSTPYVIVEKYPPGSRCEAAALLGITTYVADGKCHKTSFLQSFRVAFAAEGLVTINTFTNSPDCSGVPVTLSVATKQAAGEACVSIDDDFFDIRVIKKGNPSVHLTTQVHYDTADCTSAVQLTTTASPVDTCISSTKCNNATQGSFTTKACNTPDKFQKLVLEVFDSAPYVIVEKYTAGASCEASTLSAITTYTADGKCHKSSATASFRATRKSDGSATIVTYSDSATCSTTGTTLTVTTDQATGNSCAADGAGIPDTKVYGDGATPLFLSSAVSYETKTGDCKSPVVPTRLATTVVKGDICVASTTCSGSAVPYSGTSCGSTQSYKSDVAAVFGSAPYVIVEKYTAGASCEASTLSAITTYTADGKCHKSSATASFRATRKSDGSATIVTYSDSATCSTTGTTLTVTTDQATGNSCAADGAGIPDTKVYGDGATPLFLSSAVSYETKTGDCKSPVVPTRLATTVVKGDICVASTTCSGSAVPYSGTSCGSTQSYKSDVAAVFGSAPYVIVEKYTAGASCEASTLSAITTYTADGKCHKSSATASFRATRKSDGSATIVTYSDSATCSTTGTTLTVTAAQISGNTCGSGVKGIADTLVFVSA